MYSIEFGTSGFNAHRFDSSEGVAMVTETTALTKAEAMAVFQLLLVIGIAAVLVMIVVTVVASVLGKRKVKFFTGQIVATALFVAATWFAWYDSRGGLLWVATSLGLVVTAILVMKRRYRKYTIGKFTDELSALDDVKARPQWMLQKPSH